MHKLLITAALAASATLPAHAGSFSVSTDRSVFEATAGGPLTVEDFTDGPAFPIRTGVLNSATNLPDIGILPGMIKRGVTYSTTVGFGNFFNIDAGGGFEGGFLDTVTGERLLTVAFDDPVKAFGFDTNELSPNVKVVVHFADASSQTFTGTATGGLQFFGFTSGLADITSVTIGDLANGNFSFALDNFTFSSVTAVPEPASLALTLAGLATVGAAARRRRA